MSIQFDDSDVALVLTTLADLLTGYPEKELAVGWEEAAARVAKALRTNHDDEGTWDRFLPGLEDEPTYRIARFFQDPRVPDTVIKRGLTLEEAQEHCSDDESSSTTCTRPENIARTEQFGGWFDGFDKE